METNARVHVGVREGESFFQRQQLGIGCVCRRVVIGECVVNSSLSSSHTPRPRAHISL